MKPRCDPDFWFLFDHLWMYIIPVILFLGILACRFVDKKADQLSENNQIEPRKTAGNCIPNNKDLFVYHGAGIFRNRVYAINGHDYDGNFFPSPLFDKFILSNS